MFTSSEDYKEKKKIQYIRGDFDITSIQKSRVNLDAMRLGCYWNGFWYWAIHNLILGHHFDARNAFQYHNEASKSLTSSFQRSNEFMSLLKWILILFRFLSPFQYNGVIKIFLQKHFKDIESLIGLQKSVTPHFDKI